jgi:hypothetical protein
MQGTIKNGSHFSLGQYFSTGVPRNFLGVLPSLKKHVKTVLFQYISLILGLGVPQAQKGREPLV